MNLDVTSIRIPAIEGQDTIDYIDDALETKFPQVAGPISLDEIVATLNQNQQETKLSQGYFQQTAQSNVCYPAIHAGSDRRRT